MASNDETAVVQQQPTASGAAKSSEAKPAEAIAPADAPKYVERPPAVEPATEQAKPALTQIAKAEKPKHRHETTEARVIYELHRHGIYW